MLEQTLKQARPQAYPKGTANVQQAIDSRKSAVHNAYHISLYSSQIFRPRHPLLNNTHTRSRMGQLTNISTTPATTTRLWKIPRAWSPTGHCIASLAVSLSDTKTYTPV